MNAPFLTRAAEGYPRRGFTNADVALMIETGIINPDERFELIKGEIVPMGSEMDLHGRARSLLWRAFSEGLSKEDWFVASNLSLFLADDTEVQPDVHVFPADLKSHDVRGRDVRIAVELSATTQRYDLRTKAPIYAEYGVQELWVLDLAAEKGLLFADPKRGVYPAGRAVTPSDVLSPRAFPHIQVRLADLI